jgi:uncharacterized protein
VSVLCTIYRSAKKEGMYLYVERKEDLQRVPESLLQVFGKPQFAMTLLLKPERKLARVDREAVLLAIAEQGYFLQMPPKLDGSYNNEHNYKLPV